MSTYRPRRAALGVVAALGVLSGCGGTDVDSASPLSTVQSVPHESTATTDPHEPGEETVAPAASPPPSGLVYYAGHRSRTGELLLFAEQSGFTGRKDLLAAVRTATAGAPADPDYTSLWGGSGATAARLLWDGDEGYYDVRLPDGRGTGRPPGMSMREAHLAIQQVVWTLHSVGRTRAPVRFHVGRSEDPVTDLLGVPATGPHDTYLAADFAGVLSSMNVLAPADGATVGGVVELAGLAESFEATVGVRVLDPGGRRVVDDSTQAEECCGRLFPWTYDLDTSAFAPGVYTLEVRTDDPVGITQGSGGPSIDTKTFTVE